MRLGAGARRRPVWGPAAARGPRMVAQPGADDTAVRGPARRAAPGAGLTGPPAHIGAAAPPRPYARSGPARARGPPPGPRPPPHRRCMRARAPRAALAGGRHPHDPGTPARHGQRGALIRAPHPDGGVGCGSGRGGAHSQGLLLADSPSCLLATPAATVLAARPRGRPPRPRAEPILQRTQSARPSCPAGAPRAAPFPRSAGPQCAAAAAMRAHHPHWDPAAAADPTPCPAPRRRPPTPPVGRAPPPPARPAPRPPASGPPWAAERPATPPGAGSGPGGAGSAESAGGRRWGAGLAWSFRPPRTREQAHSLPLTTCSFHATR
jgi:hypothetical protein